MPLYSYKAISANGVSVSGKAASPSKDALIADLTRQGLRIQYIKAASALGAFPWSKVITKQQFIFFLQEFVSLQKAGLTVTDTLEMSIGQHGNEKFDQIITSILEDVRNGETLSHAFSAYKEYFDELFIAIIKTGEKCGDLIAPLEQYIGYLKSRLKVISKIKQAVTYPAFLLTSLTVIILVLFTFVMPRFAAMYANFDAKLPKPTIILMQVSKSFPIIFIILLSIVIVSYFYWRLVLAETDYGKKIEKVVHSLPVVGRIIEMTKIASIAKSMAMLTLSGTPLVESIEFIRGEISSRLFVQKLELIEKLLKEGGSFTHAVETTKLFTPIGVKFIRIGEASGNMDGFLSDVSRYYEEQIEIMLDKVLSLLEPILIVSVGLIVGSVIIIMYLPIFSLAEVIK